MAAASSNQFVETMQAKIAETWERLNTIWVKIGYDEELLERRQKSVVKHVWELLEEMGQEAEDRLTEKQQELDALLQEIVQLAKDLSIDAAHELAGQQGKPLLEMESCFTEIANGLRKRKAIRMEKYNIINEQVVKISEELGEAPMQIEFEGIPADCQVAKLEQHLNNLHHEKVRRLELFNDYKMSISELLDLLERDPKNDLERVVCSSDDEINADHPVTNDGIKVLSQEILQKLDEMKLNLQHHLENNKEQGEKYWQKIRELWSRLSEDEEVIHAFVQVHRPFSTETWKDIYKPSVLKGLHNEYDRLEEEKRRNMALFIKQVREELYELWVSKCFMTTGDVRFTEQVYLGITPFSITDFTSDLFTEELLEKHESEAEYWRSFVERNQKLIDGVNRRGHMFAQYKLLDQKSDDPSRLANRGGALLKEEKERKKLEKAIPKLEAELKQMCDVFEQSADEGNGMTKFMVYGRTIHEMIEQDWEEFHEEKRLRKEAKKKPTEAGVTSNKTQMMTTQIGSLGTRKRPATPSSTQRGLTTPNKRNRTQAITPGKTIQSPFVHPSSVAPGSSAQKVPTNRVTGTPKNCNANMSRNMGNYFKPDKTSNHNLKASRKILRKSIGKLRTGSSLHSGSSLSSSSSLLNGHKSSFSQPNLQLSSLEQLNFSEVIRGHGPVVEALKVRTPMKETTKYGTGSGTFAMPTASRSTKKTPSKTTTTALTRQASAGKMPMPIPLPLKSSGKEQIPPPAKVVSPISSYSEFTDHLLCQSTLNSSTVNTLTQNRQVLANIPPSGVAPTTPTKSGKPGLSFTPAKPFSDNCF
ncbi:Protein regulator of cytokinesis 1 [Orchesella cincta]|uniref:Protein regulator of cytokinesis 1 n=1 Tax=Orchesella cincta TaxID=48709 RepID=A0A1D2MRU7_ORCCI|nr:Protein regulator of cytokinesis 1 [Orchesella cincta]